VIWHGEYHSVMALWLSLTRSPLKGRLRIAPGEMNGPMFYVRMALGQLRKEAKDELKWLVARRSSLEGELKGVCEEMEAKERVLELVEATERELEGQGQGQPDLEGDGPLASTQVRGS
jgi:hypothetical protein